MAKSPLNPPSSKASINQIVDFIEIQTLLHGNYSFNEVTRLMGYDSDEIDDEGIINDSDRLMEKKAEIEIEIVRRANSTDNKYPFILSPYSLSQNKTENCLHRWVYSYLLFATRFNMIKNKVFNSIDGTLLFEKISAIVLKNYWGERSDTYIFGTATTGGFEDKVNELCKCLNEGSRFANKNKQTSYAQDDKLDVVVWKSFTDNQPSQLIGFAQCKTGTNWKNTLSQLQPDKFCIKWFDIQPIVIPVRLFCITDVIPLNDWYSRAADAGIIFDRLRVMDFLPSKIEAKLYYDLKSWTIGAYRSLEN
jgi:hypothetical protein